MNCCDYCKYLFADDDTGYCECKRENDFADWQWEYYQDHGYVPDCPYYERENSLFDDYMKEEIINA